MNKLKLFEAFDREKFTNEEFKEIFDYFVTDVFSKEKRNLINEIIEEAIEMIGCFEVVKGRWDNSPYKVDNPYYGVCSPSMSGYTGLSYEFQKTMMKDTPSFEDIKGWKHGWESAWFNYLGWCTRFGKKGHGYPYFEYSFKLKIISGITDYEPLQENSLTPEDMYRQLKYNDRKITTTISKMVERVARFQGNESMNLKCSVRTDNHSENSFTFDVRIQIIDLDFVPKEIIKR